MSLVSDKEESSHKRPAIRRCFVAKGIRNRTGTCALNVVMQCFLAMDAMREWFIKSLDSSPWDDDQIQQYMTETGMPMTALVRNAFAERLGTMTSTEKFPLLEYWTASDPLEDLKYFLINYCPTRYTEEGLAMKGILYFLSLEELYGPMFLKRGRHGLETYFLSLKESSGQMFLDRHRTWDKYFLSLKESLNRLFSNCDRDDGLERSTFFQNEFECKYKTTMRCLICEGQSYCLGRCWGLSLYIIDYKALVAVLKSHGTYCCTKKRFITVDDLLTFFPPPFYDTSMQCGHCGKLFIKKINSGVVLNARITFTIQKLPQTLILPVNLVDDNHRNPRNNRMVFTETLDLTKYVDPSSDEVKGSGKYKLVAMANHICFCQKQEWKWPFCCFKSFGDLVGCHVVAFVKGSKYVPSHRYDHRANDVWYEIDDSCVSRTNLSSVLNLQHIKLLIYEQCPAEQGEGRNVSRRPSNGTLRGFLRRLRDRWPSWGAGKNIVSARRETQI